MAASMSASGDWCARGGHEMQWIMRDEGALCGLLTCRSVKSQDGESSHSTREMELLMRFGFTAHPGFKSPILRL